MNTGPVPTTPPADACSPTGPGRAPAGRRRAAHRDRRRCPARERGRGGAAVRQLALARHLHRARRVHRRPAALHLDLSLATWAADGLLAVFFFVVGLELKREFLAGDLRDPRTALLPVAAAVGGMAVPRLIYVAINLANPDALVGWAIPTATDIAFALAVLAVIGTTCRPRCGPSC